jgi:3'-phosphoadenosine 5'-phosphosulfate sulfotransferase (PAPS reductase)/FAD synthetase
MIFFNDRPDFRAAWMATSFRVVMAGMGDDTVMLIAELYEIGLEPDEIVFCDTGSEFGHTYEFIGFLKSWCNEKKWSKVVCLHKTDKNGERLSVIGTAEKDGTLPGAAFGAKSCSMRFKIETADKYFNNHPEVLKAWGINKKGSRISSHKGSILRMVGINADETHRFKGWKPEDKWINVYPLADLNIGEGESKAVKRVGLYYPGKSSCFCCPHMNGKEIYDLKMNSHDDYLRIKALEDNYIATKRLPNSSTRGLCRGKTIDEKMAEYVNKGILLGEGGCSICELQ